MICQALRQPIVVQAFIEGREAETPVLGLERPVPLNPVGISIEGRRELGDTFLSFERVFSDGYEFYDLESDAQALVEPIRHTAALAVDTLQLEGFCRVDMRIDSAGQPFVIDVSTTPHLVAHGSYAFAFQRLGFNQTDMVAALTGCAIERASFLSRIEGP